MKELIQNIPKHKKIMGILSAVCLLLAAVILLWEHQMQSRLYDQQMAKRWSRDGQVSQISVFYAEGAVEDVNSFRELEQQVEQALTQASVISENENARLWIDAASCPGKVTLSSERANVEVKAVGVSGEFFQFHPQKQVSGGLLREDSMMQDGIVIDTETAWQLFGSSDVTGMQVMIGQVPHYVVGVIERAQGRIAEMAGLEKSICYLSLESLENYGTAEGGFTYEIVMPDPIKNFAFSTIQTAVGIENDSAVLVENTTRYGGLPLLKVIQNYGIRSMSLKGIVYPYWENMARGYEDIFALTLGIKILLLIVPIIEGISLGNYLWKKKTRTWKDGVKWLQEKIYEAGTRKAKRKQKRDSEIENFGESR